MPASMHLRLLAVLLGLALCLSAGAEGVPQLLQQLKSSDATTKMAAMQQLGRMKAREAVDALIAATHESGPTLRAQAATALGQIGDGKATPALAGLLKDDFVLVRAAAADALGALKDRAATTALLEAARNPDSGIRAAAITALGKTGDPQAVPDLLAWLDDADTTVRAAAATALGRLHDPRAAAAFLPGLHSTDPAARLTAVNALAPLHYPPARPTLLALLRDESPAVRAAAAEALGTYRDPKNTDSLLAVVQNTEEDAAVRAACMNALALTRDPRLLEPVLQILEEGTGKDNAPLIEAAIDIAGRLRDTRFIPALLQLIHDRYNRNNMTDFGVYTALRNIGTPALTTLLANIKPGVDRRQREIAISLLGEWQSPRSISPLLTLLNDPNLEIQDETVLTLTTMLSIDGFYSFWSTVVPSHEPIAFFPPDLNPGPWCRDSRLENYLLKEAAHKPEYYNFLGKLDSNRAVTQILSEIKTASPHCKQQLHQQLTNFNDPRVADILLTDFAASNGNVDQWGLLDIINPTSQAPLFTALKSKNAETRKWAAAILGTQRDARAVPALLQTIGSDPVPEVREYCALALGLIGDNRAVPALINRLSDPVEWARSAAAWALGQIGDKRAIAPLKKKLNPADARFTVRVARSLVQLGDPEGADLLVVSLSSSDEMVHRIALDTIHDLPGSRQVEALQPMLEGNDDEDWIQASERLKTIRDPAAVDPLLPLLNHENSFIRAAAAHALGVIKAENAREPLAACLDDDDESVAGEAAIALVRLNDPRGLPPALDILADPVSSQRADVLLALSDGKPLADPRLLATLPGLLDDPDPFIAVLTARALAHYNDARGADYLIGLLSKNEDPTVYFIAVPYLAALHDSRAVKPLMVLLPKVPFQARLKVIEAIAASGSRETFPLLTNLAKHPDPRVREAVARGLAETAPDYIDDKETVLSLLELLSKDDASRVRDAAGTSSSLRHLLGLNQ